MKFEELVPTWFYPLMDKLNEPNVWYIYTLPMVICLAYFAFIILRQKSEPNKYMIQYFDTYWDVCIAVGLSIVPILNWFMVVCIVNSFLNKRV